MKQLSPAKAGMLVGSLLMSAMPAALAQTTYPTRTIRIIVPTSPPGGADVVARSIAPLLSERLGQQVIVDNRAGASTMLGGELAAKAPPDGYTLVMGISTLAINPATFKHVPYRGGGESIIALVSGHVSVTVASMLGAMPHVRSGRLRALGVTSAKRVATAPQVPTIAEAGVPGYESLQWYGLLAPAGTSRDIIARLNKETVAILRTPEISARLANDGAEVIASTPEEFGAYIRAETEKWAKVVKAAGIKPE